MNEIDLMAKIDRAAPTASMHLDTSMTVREVELANMELERRGSLARFVAIKSVTFTGDPAFIGQRKDPTS